MDIVVIHSKSKYGHPFVQYGLTPLPDEDTPCCAGWLLGTSGYEHAEEMEQALQTVLKSRTRIKAEHVRSKAADNVKIRAMHVYTTEGALRATQNHLRQIFVAVTLEEIGFYWTFVPSLHPDMNPSLFDIIGEHHRDKQFAFIYSLRIIRTEHAIPLTTDLPTGGILRHWIMYLRNPMKTTRVFYNVWEGKSGVTFITRDRWAEEALDVIDDLHNYLLDEKDVYSPAWKRHSPSIGAVQEIFESPPPQGARSTSGTNE